VKRLIGIAVIMALLVTLVVVVMPVGANSEKGLVYSAVLGEIPGSAHTLERGEIKVWADGSVKVEIKVADAVNQTYFVNLHFGPNPNRQLVNLGEITTDNKGHAIRYYNVNDLSGLPSPIPDPGFAIIKFISQGQPPTLAGFVPIIPYTSSP